jgi:hypothetical protein
MTIDSQLRADCAKCCGLCCVAPAFDADQGFGFDKPAHTACRNLDADHRCAIHAALRARGFPACATFDCYGAGQWLTAPGETAPLARCLLDIQNIRAAGHELIDTFSESALRERVRHVLRERLLGDL